MRKLGTVLAVALPTAAHASGGDILTLFWLELFLLAAVVASLLIGRITAKGKIFVFGAYVLGAVVPWWLTATWPYRENLVLINSLCIGGPLLLWLPAFVMARKRYGKT